MGANLSNLKELAETAVDRLKNPALSSIVISFFALNWKALFYVCFANGKSPEQRFQFFDDHTSFLSLLVFPVLVGLLAAIAISLFKVIVALISEHPENWLNQSRRRNQHRLKLAEQKFQLEEEKQKRIAERNQEAVEIKAKQERQKAIIEEQKLREEAILAAAEIDRQVNEIDNQIAREEAIKKIEQERKYTVSDALKLPNGVETLLDQLRRSRKAGEKFAAKVPYELFQLVKAERQRLLNTPRDNFTDDEKRRIRNLVTDITEILNSLGPL